MSAGHTHAICCPACELYDGFTVEFRGTAKLTAEGSEDIGDHEFGDDDVMTCLECDHSGPAKTFHETYDKFWNT